MEEDQSRKHIYIYCPGPGGRMREDSDPLPLRQYDYYSQLWAHLALLLAGAGDHRSGTHAAAARAREVGLAGKERGRVNSLRGQ